MFRWQQYEPQWFVSGKRGAVKRCRASLKKKPSTSSRSRRAEQKALLKRRLKKARAEREGRRLRRR